MPAVTDMMSYKDAVLAAMARAKETGKAEVFENSGPSHARIVLDVMMENSSRSLDVISACMSDDVWCQENAEAFLNRNPTARVRVLLDDVKSATFDRRRSVAHALCQHKRVEVRQLPQPMRSHLCVADGRHVRLEYGSKSREASVSFGDLEFGMRAGAYFNQKWDSAQPYDKLAQA